MIRGPSGGGKTTLLNVVGTIDSATKGDLSKKPQKIYNENMNFQEFLEKKLTQSPVTNFYRICVWRRSDSFFKLSTFWPR